MTIRICIACLLLIAAPSAGAGHGTNELAGHPSPYLAMHADDPVHWHVWSTMAIEEARREDRLLYVSIGYFSCYWCHVMHKESYRDAETSEMLNSAFVPVKVDRELQPALDAYLIDFVQRTRGVAGWPLNVFVTPEGYPLTGLTYLPREPFQGVLTKLQERWDSDKEVLKAMAAQAAALMREQQQGVGSRTVSAGIAKTYRQDLVAQALHVADDLAGGFGSTLKFPSVPQLLALLSIHRLTPDPKLEEFLTLTFQEMARQGLRDQLGGGFFRYTTDPNWQIPHFEKMLYDNALLADAYLRAADVLAEPEFRGVAQDTVDFMLRELRVDPGAFIASLSAVDEDGTEGGPYLWQKETLEQALTEEELKVARPAWGLEGEPSLEAGHLPVQAANVAEVVELTGLEPKQVSALLASARRKLMQERLGRPAPRDIKLLAGWNGLALGALARLARVEDGRNYHRAANELRDYLVHTLWDGERLLRARSEKGEVGTASLEDYAYVATGLTAWAELTGKDEDYRWAHRIINEGWRRFHSPKGWRLEDQPLIPYGNEEAVLSDGPMLSPSAVLLDATVRVAKRLDDETLLDKAHRLLRQESEAVGNSPFYYATHVDLLLTHLPEG